MPTVTRTVSVALVGLGPIGQAVGKLVAATPGLQIVAATDQAVEKTGKDVGAVLGLSKRLKVKVEDDTDAWLKKARADVAILCTGSDFKTVKPLIAALVARGMNVITTCEEMAFPTPATAAGFKDLDKAAAKKKVSVLGTGVNPGYAMDALALALTAPCSHVERIAVTRVVDAASRRLTLQRKVGAGLNLNQFRRAITEKSIRHVGLLESAHMIASALGWKLDRIDETLEPVVAPRDMDTEYLRVPAGSAAGIRQCVRGYRGGEPAVSLDLQMYVGAENPRDHILVDGTPRIDLTIAGGIAGDPATAALVLNCIPGLLSARPGLITMKDLPLVHLINPLELRELPRKK